MAHNQDKTGPQSGTKLNNPEASVSPDLQSTVNQVSAVTALAPAIPAPVLEIFEQKECLENQTIVSSKTVQMANKATLESSATRSLPEWTRYDFD